MIELLFFPWGYWCVGFLYFWLVAYRKPENRDGAVFNYCVHLWPLAMYHKIRHHLR